MENLHALNNFLILLQLFLDSILTYLDLLSFSISFPSVLIFDDSYYPACVPFPSSLQKAEEAGLEE